MGHSRHLLDEGSVLRAEVGVPSCFLGLGHAPVFHSGVAIGSRELDSVTLIFADLGVVSPVEVAVDFHFVFGKRSASFLIVIEKSEGLGDGDSIEGFEMTKCGREGPVGGLVLAHEEEGFFLISLVEPLDRFVSGDVGAVAVELFDASVHLFEDGIVVVALTRKDFPVVKTNGV